MTAMTGVKRIPAARVVGTNLKVGAPVRRKALENFLVVPSTFWLYKYN